MARGSLSKVRWKNDRIRKAKARQRRRMTQGTKLGTPSQAQAPGTETTDASAGATAPAS